MCAYFTKMSDTCFTNVTFDMLQDGCCRQTHVNPFTLDFHVIGFECKNAFWWFLLLLFFTLVIKVGQNFLYTRMGQVERELMQKNPEDRRLYWLLVYEAISGVIGIFSILVITGNNAFIWVWVILCNCGGVYWAHLHTPADHHSISLEILNMLKKHDESPKNSNVRKVVKELRRLLNGEEDMLEESEDVPLLRKRLII